MEFIGARRWALVPDRSKPIVSSRISICAASRIGSSRDPVVVEKTLGLVGPRSGSLAISWRVRLAVYASSSSMTSSSTRAPNFVDQLADPPVAELVGRHLRAQVAGGLVLGTDVGQEELEDVVVDHASLRPASPAG